MNFDLLKKITLANDVKSIEEIFKNHAKDANEEEKIIYTLALKNRKKLARVEEEKKFAQGIFNATKLLNISYDFQDRLREFCSNIKEIIDFDRMTIGVFKKGRVFFDICAENLPDGKIELCSSFNNSNRELSAAWVFRSQKPYLINDLAENCRFPEDAALYKHEGIRAILRVPLIYNKKCIGVYEFYSKKSKKYTKKHLRVAKLLSGHIATLLYNKMLFDELQENKQEHQKSRVILKAINELSEVLLHHRLLDSMLFAALEKILSLVNREIGAIYLYNENKKILELKFSFGLDEEFQKMGKYIMLGEKNTGKAAASRKMIIASDLSSQINNEFHQRLGIKSAVYIPLLAKGKVIGVINIGATTLRAFDENEISILKVLANYCALFIERQKMVAKLEELGAYDPLSKLYNRSAFFNHLEHLLARGGRYSEKFSILMLDIDFFKKYNDTCGHLAGDQIIKKLGKIIAKTVRIGDIAARYGGEEFVVLAYDADSENAYYLAERIRKQVQEKLHKDGITISIGVASYPKHGLDIETIIKKADEALYRAKRSGRNQVQICEK